jgi:hypothetical protein
LANPVSDFTTLQFSEILTEKSTVFLFESSGKVVRQFEVQDGTSEMQIDLQDLSSGMYRISLIVNGKQQSKSLIKI